jgi:hypothetical protein
MPKSKHRSLGEFRVQIMCRVSGTHRAATTIACCSPSRIARQEEGRLLRQIRARFTTTTLRNTYGIQHR